MIAAVLAAVITGALLLLMPHLIEPEDTVPAEPLSLEQLIREQAAGGKSAGEILECERLTDRLSADIESSRECAVDADCALASFGCPHGCIDAVNTARLEPLLRRARSIQAACAGCVYSCMAPVFEWRAICQQGLCVVEDGSAEQRLHPAQKRQEKAGQ